MSGDAGALTLTEVARRAGVTPATLRRWADGGLIPGYDGTWTPPTAAHARIDDWTIATDWLLARLTADQDGE